jgi:hypothetical protein
MEGAQYVYRIADSGSSQRQAMWPPARTNEPFSIATGFVAQA